MKKLIVLITLTAAFAFATVESSVKGKLVNGTVTEIINAKGELVYGNTTAADVSFTIKSFEITYAVGKTVIVVSPEKGKNTLSKSDIDSINQNKGTRATVKNVIAADAQGKEIKLPEIAFYIE